jgi:hypothetical protein
VSNKTHGGVFGKGIGVIHQSGGAWVSSFDCNLLLGIDDDGVQALEKLVAWAIEWSPKFGEALKT